MYDDIKTTKTTGLKKLKNVSFKHLKKIFSIISLGLLILLVTFVSSKTSAATVSIEEIEDNSIRYKVLEVQNQDCETLINQCTLTINKNQKEQEELSYRNNLLRELFSQGKNQK